jgi:hypothetical protein
MDTDEISWRDRLVAANPTDLSWGLPLGTHLSILTGSRKKNGLLRNDD